MGTIFSSDRYDIRFNDIDYKERLLITSIVEYLGDIAIKHSESLGNGLKYLKEHKLGWVIYKWDIDVLRYPSYGEKLTVRTWAYSFRKFYAYRQYDILNADGQVVCRANSIWFLIDTDKRKPMRISDEMYETYGIGKEDTTPLNFEKLQLPGRVDSQKEFSVRYSDIDSNRHVNNSKYIGWSIETIPLEIVEKYTLTNLKVNYEKETKYGDNVNIITEIQHENDKIICRHEVKDGEGNKTTLLQTEWSL